ncbi:MAG: hypothetical protein WA144_03540 [Candidatus Methanoperedens sp.]
MGESETKSTGTEKIPAVRTNITFTPGPNQPPTAIPTDSTAPDISKIIINPIEYPNTKLLE